MAKSNKSVWNDRFFGVASLITIFIFDLITAIDPTETIVGFALAPIAGIIVWGLETNRFVGKVSFSTALGSGLAKGLATALIVAIPTELPGVIALIVGLSVLNMASKERKEINILKL